MRVALPEAFTNPNRELLAAPARLAGYREHLLSTRARSPLFDTKGFTRDFEALLIEIYDRAAAA